MAETAPLSVLFLWHQHQPVYKDALANRYEMPWVRLHATKDYYDMVALLDEFPTIKSNFNLVPSLLIQLDDYAKGDVSDKFLDLTLAPAEGLSFEDQRFILQNFFMAHWEHMIDPHERYRELLDKRGRVTSPEGLLRAQKFFKAQDWRDLQMWFNLAWFDPLWREKDAFIKTLFEKQKNFTEDEIRQLVNKQRVVCGLVVAKHRELQDRGQIEVTTTPFFHPILPLLCDTDVARDAMPHVNLPAHRFQHPEDAATHVKRAIEDYRARFGRSPEGMWPSEGSVSEEAVRLFTEQGIRWIATDEAILERSLATPSYHRDDVYEPYQLKVGEKDLHFFFRDHELSDAIGFVYASWDTQAAVDDFINRLHEIRQRLQKKDDVSRPHVVSVILDGENCWEYYKDDGLPFLRALYSRLAADPLIKTVRASDYLNETPQTKTLPKLWPGSWINSNFAIWIGHSEDNRAWDLLFRTRAFLQNTLSLRPDLAETPQAAQAWEEIYIAEGSDWCWWYGDDHSSANDAVFDYLFRKHLMNVYALIGEKIPEDLRLPIKTKRVKAAIIAPADFITPVMDGRITNYFEWHSAGIYQTEAGGTGTMHKSENLVKTIYYGFDRENLYFRLDFSRPLSADILTGTSIQFGFDKPESCQITASFTKEKGVQVVQTAGSGKVLESAHTLTGAYQKVLEVAIPLARLSNPDKLPYHVAVVIQKDGLEQERWPSDSLLTIAYPSTEAFIENWII